LGKKTSKTKSKPWGPAQPHLLGAANTIRNTVDGNQGNLEGIAGDIRGQLPQLQQMAFGSNPTMNAANSYATDVLGGKYLNSNPHLDGMISATANDVSDRVNSLFGRGGSSLGTRHAGVLTQELAEAENAMRFNNYGAERQQMGNAAAMAPNLNAAQYAGVAPWLAASQTAGQLPYSGLSSLGQIGGLFGGYGSQTQPGGWGQALLSAAAQVGSAAMMASDRRLKADIEEIGLWDGKDGLKRYRYRYKFDPSNTMVEGVMADEVEKLRPHAFVPNFRGEYAGVNYGAL
jgi:hypothetical protein